MIRESPAFTRVFRGHFASGVAEDSVSPVSKVVHGKIGETSPSQVFSSEEPSLRR